ncbi:hypothetical protein H7Y21_02140 [Arenimonas sp.]|nr:hypothetical protein [Candidatus Parcubacteria bacterium]
MKNIINHKEIENILSSFKSNESVSLSLSEKDNMLASVFARVADMKIISSTVSHVHARDAKSPFHTYKTHFTQYLRYSIPVILLAVISTQAGGVLTHRSKIAIADINEVKSTLNNLKRNNSIKSNLSKNQEDIQEIKLNLASANSTNAAKNKILAEQVSIRSKEIRNQVSALVSENKISEAKNIALDLESALKADELYKVSTSVEQEVFSAIDLRVTIEKKESNNISSSTESDIKARIDKDKKEFVTYKSNASTTDMLTDAMKAINVAESYVNKGDFENAIISLQLHDRIVAELKIILLP